MQEARLSCRLPQQCLHTSHALDFMRHDAPQTRNSSFGPHAQQRTPGHSSRSACVDTRHAGATCLASLPRLVLPTCHACPHAHRARPMSAATLQVRIPTKGIGRRKGGSARVARRRGCARCDVGDGGDGGLVLRGPLRALRDGARIIRRPARARANVCGLLAAQPAACPS